METIFGYFDSPEQTEPAFDPGLPAECPYCHALVERGQRMNTISLCAQDPTQRKRSYFYRCHAYCYSNSDEDTVSAIESAVLFSILSSRPGAN